MRRPLRSLLQIVFLATPCMASVAMAQPIQIVAFGDSNTYGMNMPRSKSYPAQLETLLRSKGLDVVVTNAGTPGSTSSDAVYRVGSAVPPGTHLAIVTFGVNDARRGVPPAEIEQNLNQVVAKLRAQNTRVILCGRRAPFPPGYNIGAYRSIFGSVARRSGATPCNFLDGVPANGFQADGHENEIGNAAIAARFARMVGPSLRQRR